MAEVIVAVYGREGCNRCAAARKKIGFFLDKWGFADMAEMVYHDMATEDGMAEAAFNEVMDVPAIIIRRNGQDVSRWDGELPDSRQLRLCIENTADAPAN